MRCLELFVVRRLGALTIAGSALLGCSGTHDEAATSVARQAVTGETAASLSWSVSIGIERNGVLYDGGLCSGTLIAPDVVLTAAHCVSVVANVKGDCGLKVVTEQKPNLVAFANAPTSPTTLAAFPHRARKVVVPADAKQGVCENDIALVFLDSPMEDATPRVPSFKTPAVGDRIVTVGFGKTCDETDAGCAWGTRRMSVAAPITMMTLSEAEIATDRGKEHEGDSGGGALSEDLGTVVGIVSAGSGPYSVFTSVAKFETWLKSTVVTEAEASGSPAPPWAGVVPAGATPAPAPAPEADPTPASEPAAPAPASSSSCAMSRPAAPQGWSAFGSLGLLAALVCLRRSNRRWCA